MRIFKHLILFGLLLSSTLSSLDMKQEVARVEKLIAEAKPEMKAPLLVQQAILYFEDQNQEKAFEVYHQALESVLTSQEPSIEESENYKQALSIYLNHSGSTPQESAERILDQFGVELEKNPEDHQLAFVVSAALANVGNYPDFFLVFFEAYRHLPNHFMAYRTKAILHIKLMERARTERERQFQRESITENFAKAIETNPRDDSTYKLIIYFANTSQYEQIVKKYFTQLIEQDVKVPRKDIGFYVQHAIEANQKVLAQRFLDKAKKWYAYSRSIEEAQAILDVSVKSND